MARRPLHDTERLGRALATARRAGVAWDALVARYGFTRARLYQIWRAAGSGGKTKSGRRGRGKRSAAALLRMEIALGCAVIDGRRRREPWKVLVRRYGYSRTRLYQLMVLAEDHARQESSAPAAQSPAAGKNVHEHLGAGQGRCGPPHDGGEADEAD